MRVLDRTETSQLNGSLFQKERNIEIQHQPSATWHSTACTTQWHWTKISISDRWRVGEGRRYKSSKRDVRQVWSWEQHKKKKKLVSHKKDNHSLWSNTLGKHKCFTAPKISTHLMRLTNNQHQAFHSKPLQKLCRQGQRNSWINGQSYLKYVNMKLCQLKDYNNKLNQDIMLFTWMK